MGAVCLATGAARAQPVNDACASATPVVIGTPAIGTAAGATPDGACSCSITPGGLPDVYHSFRSASAGIYTFSLCAGTTWDTVISVHSACPATTTNQLACDDESCRPPGSTGFGFPSRVSVLLGPDTQYVVRISGFDGGAGFNTYQLGVSGPTATVGACCVGTTCSQVTAAACQLAGGVYQGNFSSCIAPALNPSSYAATGAFPANIPDNLPTGVERTITVPGTFSVGDVRVTMNVTHTFLGDLTMTLTHAGRTAVLLQRVRGGLTGTSANLGGVYVFSDAAAITPWDTPVVLADDNSAAVLPPSDYRASDVVGATVSLRSVFNGLSAAGDWTLKIVDGAPGDGGSLASFSLTLDQALGDVCVVTQPTSGACCYGPVGYLVGSTCSVLSPVGCSSLSGTYRGTNSVCELGAGNPIACCKANFNQTGGVSVQDIFDFLGAWFAGLPAADFNGAGGVSVQDIFDMLGAWFVGCRVQ